MIDRTGHSTVLRIRSFRRLVARDDRFYKMLMSHLGMMSHGLQSMDPLHIDSNVLTSRGASRLPVWKF